MRGILCKYIFLVLIHKYTATILVFARPLGGATPLGLSGVPLGLLGVLLGRWWHPIMHHIHVALQGVGC